MGEALNTFGSMPTEDSFDYKKKVMVTLLTRFRLTAEELHEKSRKSSGPEFSSPSV